MAQIHALTPEGRLPTAAVAHVQELVQEATYRSGQRIVPLENGATGTAYLQRNGAEVELYVRDLVVPGDGRATFLTIPQGFRCNRLPLYGLLGRTGNRALATFDIGPGHTLSQGTSHTNGMYMHFKWATNDAIPTTLPGTPA